MSRLIDLDTIEFLKVDGNKEFNHGVDCCINTLLNTPTVEAIPLKQLEEMYEKFQKKLWSEHENVRGDEMIEVGFAEEFLEEFLMEFGCWDSEVEK